MLSRGVRTFASTAHRAAELSTKVDASNHYRVQLAKAQGHVNGFVGGIRRLVPARSEILTYCQQSVTLH